MNGERYDFDDGASAVRSLQRKLRVISSGREDFPRVFIDGVYGKETADAVKKVQNGSGLPVTGKTDYDTFLAVEKAYGNEMKKRPPSPNGGAYPSFPEMNGNRINYGDVSGEVLLLQYLFELTSELDENLFVSPNGTFDEETLRSVRYLQNILGKEETDFVDAELWNALCLICSEKRFY